MEQPVACRSRWVLNKARIKGEGPPFKKVGGRVFYDADEVDRWLDGHRVDPRAARLDNQ